MPLDLIATHAAMAAVCLLVCLAWYPCCEPGTCAACGNCTDQNTYPCTITLDIPEDIDDGTCECSGLVGTYILPQSTVVGWACFYGVGQVLYEFPSCSTYYAARVIVSSTAGIAGVRFLENSVAVRIEYQIKETSSDPWTGAGYHSFWVNKSDDYQCFDTQHILPQISEYVPISDFCAGWSAAQLTVGA